MAKVEDAVSMEILRREQQRIGGEIKGDKLFPIARFLTPLLPLVPACDLVRRWHVVQTEPQQELTVAKELEKAKFDAWCPKEPKKRRLRAERYCTVQRPMLPGYVLAGFDARREPWQAIRATQIIHGERIEGMRGVVRLFMISMRPVPIGEKEIARLQFEETERSSGRRAKSCDPSLQPDMLLRVLAGPFSGFLGFAIEVRKHDVLVELDIFGRKTRSTMGPDQFEPV